MMDGLQAKKTEWDLTPLMNGDDDPETESKRKEVEEKAYTFINKWQQRKDYLEKPEVLKEALDEYEDWKRNFGVDGTEGFYFQLRTEQDKNNPILKAKYNKIREFGLKIANDIKFFRLNIAKISKEKQKEFIKYGPLDKYKHFLEKAFIESDYLLSEAEEKILSLKSDPAYNNWINMLSGFLAKEEREILVEKGKRETASYTTIKNLMDSTDKEVRDGAARAFNEVLNKHVESSEAEINSILMDKRIDDDLRKMPRPDLARHIEDDIESDSVDALIKAVSDRFDISRRYYELKAKLLGLKRLEYHEKNVPYGKIDKKYSYEDSIKLVYDTFYKLDRRFAEILERFAEKGQIDVYPKKGKRDGAFCSNDLIKSPTYILLNHSDRMNDVLTLAHEIGHGINAELMKENQNALNFDTPKSTAEVASTFMEDFVLEELLKGANDEMKLSILMMKLNDDITTIFRQVACYKFEQDLHSEFRKKGYLSKEEIGRIFKRNMEAYMGEAIEQSPGSENWWISWPHIRWLFYVYSYASGLLISKALQASVRKDFAFINKVKKFLSAGTSDSPKNIFLELGIDISNPEFWNSGLKEIDKLLKETEELAKKLGKI